MEGNIVNAKTERRRSRKKAKELSVMRIERAREFGIFMTTHNATIRRTAECFGVSKSVVHKEVLEVLPVVSPELYAKVKKVIAHNKSEACVRGGSVTKEKYDIKRLKKQLMENAIN